MKSLLTPSPVVVVLVRCRLSQGGARFLDRGAEDREEGAAGEAEEEEGLSFLVFKPSLCDRSVLPSSAFAMGLAVALVVDG